MTTDGLLPSELAALDRLDRLDPRPAPPVDELAAARRHRRDCLELGLLGIDLAAIPASVTLDPLGAPCPPTAPPPSPLSSPPSTAG